jgi:hypothetical protein
MADHSPTHGGEHIDNAMVHHEESDINIRGVLQFAAGLAVIAIVIHVLIWGMFRLLDRREARADTSDYPLAVGQDTVLPPEPRLQTMPRQDLRDLRAIENEKLNGYTWVDRGAGTVRIPIKAMRLTLERGLPSRPAPPAEQAAQGAPAQPAAAVPQGAGRTPAGGAAQGGKTQNPATPAGNQGTDR